MSPRHNGCGLPSRKPASNKPGNRLHRDRTVGDATLRGLHFHQRLQPEHAPRAVADHRHIEVPRRDLFRRSRAPRRPLPPRAPRHRTERRLQCSRMPPRVVDQEIGHLRRNPAVRFAIQHHRRRQRAVAQAVDRFHREAAIRRRLAQLHAQPVLNVSNQRLRNPSTGTPPRGTSSERAAQAESGENRDRS